MSLRLRLLSFYTPKRIILGELLRVSKATVGALDSLVEKECSTGVVEGIEASGMGIEALREQMAVLHEKRVSELCHCMGEDEGVALGRRTLYKVGMGLGKDVGKRLGAGNSLKDTLLAARIMYRVLGIEFTFKPEGGGGSLFVSRCALSNHYSGRTCRVLSAADEGVLRGLNPRLTMRFIETIPDGARACEAKIIIDGGR
jgi:hypothetical protein